MTSLVNYYKNLQQKHLSDNTWILPIQKNAMECLERLNFPSKNAEDWKYSPIATLLNNEFSVNKSSLELEKRVLETVALSRQNDAPNGIKIPLINGGVIGLDAIRARLPQGVIIESISDAVNNYPKLVSKYLNKILNIKHGMQALNSAMLTQGLFIYVPENVTVTEPILLTHVNTEDNIAIFLRHVIVLEKNSSLKIIEDYQGSDDCKYFTNAITEVEVSANAEIQYFKVQREGHKSLHFGHVFVRQLENSQFTSNILNTGGKWSRTDVSVDLTERNSRCILNGVYMPINEQFMENTIFVNHAVPNCYSEQDYRGIAADKGQAVFNGKIYVAKDAISTEARQQNKNLLLSNFAKVYTKPQLEIFADDVSCTHGATVGQLDEDALFYLATRGIEEREARRYLIHAFIDANITKVSDKALSSWISSLLEQQMR